MRILLVAGDAELKALLEREQFQVDGAARHRLRRVASRFDAL